MPIKYVRTEGVFQYLSKEDIKTALEPLVTTGFLEADMQAIHQAVSALPWVDTVAVKRIWPDTIDIKVTEKKPYTRWGKDSLITEQGVIFAPKTLDLHQQLIVVTAPEQRRLDVLEIMKGIKTALADESLELAEFTINNRWSWNIKLTSGLDILLGREEQLKKLQRFLKTLPLLGKQQVDAMAVVDLRYPNGYAVTWKTEAPVIDRETVNTPEDGNIANQQN
ncbi:MAG: cell division protein FtsQ/DivIB [Methylovulum sp.]|uniref:cell division protein FtsQ/DivIB n=1 Tax=Methylovulum sp. TaxID=1916980 RepID=UPI00261CCE6C|nr:cell division protein FtsQ/DivIB [Methylovulum sp.]MDD2722934.1 cell division protein FtsQ/DivIB [Methylovulum sp.]MDD5123247.1 cell division protein FtsQ/DivIB [Methylovulum sp.]